MDGRDSTQSLLVLRKLTRAIADVVRAQMTEHLATLAPLLRPKMVLGDHVEDGTKESTRRSDKAFKELQALYETIVDRQAVQPAARADASASTRRIRASRSRRSTPRMSSSRDPRRGRSWSARR